MSFTDHFIHRPMLALAVSTLILLLGLNALRFVELREFPKLELTTISIVTAYPGASAKLVEGFITVPVQQAVAAVQGLDYMTSSTSQGLSTVTLNLQLGFDSNITMTEVLTAVAGIKGQLPASAESPSVSRNSGGDSALMYLSFSSDAMSREQITEYLSREVQTKLQTLDGVSQAGIMGGRYFAMRIWLDPNRLAGYGLDLAQVAQALTTNNHLASVGSTDGSLVRIDIQADTDLQTVKGFEDLVIAHQGSRLIRLREVARVELGADGAQQEVINNGQPAVLLKITPAPGANPLTVAQSVKERMPEIQQQLPVEMKASVVYDASININASIDEVLTTLMEAAAIVILIVFLFLGSLRSVLVPLVTIPLSIIGVLFLMQVLGFSINLLTLLALVLAVGLVVDDAIVMVENVSRHMEEGLSPLDAALKGAREITLPIIAMTLTLAAVYAPIGFMGGLTGSLFKEFAFTLAASVVISGVVALVLSPVMCAMVLKAGERGRLEQISERLFAHLQAFYERGLHSCLQNRFSVLILLLAILSAIPYLWLTSKSELAPQEDKGSLYFSGSAQRSASLEFTSMYSDQIGQSIQAIPETEGYFILNGVPGPNGLIGSQVLKPWDQRERSQVQIQQQLQAALGEVAGLKMVTFAPPSLPGSGGGLPVQFVMSANLSFDELYESGQMILEQALKSGLFIYADLDLKLDNPLANVKIDKTMANELGLSMADIGDALALGYSGAYVDRFDRDERSYKVIPQLEVDWRTTTEGLKDIPVRTSQGSLVRLGSVVDIQYEVGPESLNQFQQLNSVTLSALLSPGVSMGEAITFLQKEAADSLPPGFTTAWKSESRNYIKEGNSLLIAFGMALVVILLVLAAQFNSLRDPLIVLLTVPMAIAAALVPINMGYSSLNIYTQIGLVTLIGLISKQGILMVEFANQLRASQGLSVNEAIAKASSTRLRPILMTASAIVIAVIPLITADGAGAASRRDLGMVVFFGMSIGTLLCLFTVPVVYSYVAPPLVHKNLST